MKSIEDQFAEAVHLIDLQAKGAGVARAKAVGRVVKPILDWLHWYPLHRPPAAAAELLAGTRASILEVVAYVGMGLGRSSLTAIRAQVDLLLSYTFFKDHPVEWTKVTELGEGFKLRGDIYSYHKDNDKNFVSRLNTLEKCSGQSLETHYKTLSAHIHSQSIFTIPENAIVADLIWTDNKLNSIVRLQESVAHSLSNFLLSVHVKEWMDLPQHIISNAQTTLGEKQKEFFTS